MTAARIRVPALTALVAAAIGLGAGLLIAATVTVTDTNTVRLRIAESQFADGVDTGWHVHPGPAIVQVLEGQFRIYQNGCEPKIVHEGETYIEVPRVPVRAVARGAIKWTTTQVLPNLAGDATQVEVPSPCPQ